MCPRMENPVSSDAVKRQRIDSQGSSVRLPPYPSMPTPPQQYNNHARQPSDGVTLPPLTSTPTDHSSPPSHRSAPPTTYPHPPPPPPHHHHQPPPAPPPATSLSTTQHSPYSPGRQILGAPRQPPPAPPLRQQQPQHQQYHSQQPTHMLHDQHPTYDYRNAPHPGHERPPTTDPSHMHGLVANNSQSPDARAVPALKPLDTSFPEHQPYSHHNQGSPPGYPPQGPPLQQLQQYPHIQSSSSAPPPPTPSSAPLYHHPQQQLQPSSSVPPPPPQHYPPPQHQHPHQHQQHPHSATPLPQTPNTPAHPNQHPQIQPYYDPNQAPPPQTIQPDVQRHGPPYSAAPYHEPSQTPWVATYNQSLQLPGQTSVPKKASRAQQACETCRQRKAKCDEGKPTCAYCQESGNRCVYKENPPAKVDRAQKEILDSLKETKADYGILAAAVKQLEARMETWNQHMKSVFEPSESSRSFKQSEYLVKTESSQVKGDNLHGQPGYNTLARHSYDPPHHQEMYDDSAHFATYHGSQDRQHVDRMKEHQTSPHAGMPPPVVEDMEDMEDAANLEDPDADPNADPSLDAGVKTGHVVMANQLLQWPSIKDLLGIKVPKDDYARSYEERKGALRVFGRGQGKDSYNGARGESPSSPIESTSDEISETSSYDPVVQNHLWGDSKIGPPNMPGDKFFGDEKYHLGGLAGDGILQLDKKTMVSLMESYISNIHILHPILDITRLQILVERVWREYNPVEAAGDRSPFIPGTPHATVNGKHAKRKRSVAAGTSDDGHARSSSSPSPHLATRTYVVLVLLVMALGKMCQHKDPLPGFAPETFTTEADEINQVGSAKSSLASSPASTTDKRSLIGIYGRKRQAVPVPIKNRGFRKGDRNVDVIPGLAYYALATERLGTLKGENDIIAAQAYLLAAIYVAQLGCVLESYTYVNDACRVCCLLVRDTKFTRHKADEADSYKTVFLSTLQLESDLLAEMDWQPSALQTLDPTSAISFPNASADRATDVPNVPDIEGMDDLTSRNNDDISTYYVAQLSLRRCLNTWQQILYPAKNANLDHDPVLGLKSEYSITNRNVCDSTLASIRTIIDQHHPLMSWADTDEPAPNINAARFRGKYYGAKYVLHRPFLRHALHTLKESNITASVRSLYEIYKKDPARYKLPAGPTEGVNPEDWLLAQQLISCDMCVSAAKQSTVAFDGVLKTRRLMVTNVFGTAHAQFGNMLVLSAVRVSRVLGFLIDARDYDRLMNRTIDFLESLAPISTTLKKDAMLLSVIRQKIHRGYVAPVDYENSIATSFGSASVQ